MKLAATLALAVSGILTLASISTATVYDLATNGTISSSSTFTCNHPTPPTCGPCLGNSPTSGPNIVFGQGGFNGLSAWGSVQGTFNAEAVINGVSLPGHLLPEGSFFRSGLALRHSFCLGFSGNDPCPGYACGVTYQIGSLAGSVTRSTTNITIDLPAIEAVNGTFRFDFCNHHIAWGAGCSIVGSVANRWLVVTPAPVVPAVLAGGDSSPQSFSGTGVTVDKSAGPGGKVTVTRLSGALPPSDTPPVPLYPDYWDLRSDLQPASFAAQIRISFDPARLTEGTDESSLTIWRMDHTTRAWEALTTTVDVGTHTAVADGLDRFSTFCLALPPKVPTRKHSWGELKRTYR